MITPSVKGMVNVQETIEVDKIWDGMSLPLTAFSQLLWGTASVPHDL